VRYFFGIFVVFALLSIDSQFGRVEHKIDKLRVSPLAPPPDARNCPVPIMPDSPLPSGTDGSGYRSGENGKANSRSRQ